MSLEPAAHALLPHRPATLSALLTDISLVGTFDWKREYFVVVVIDDQEVAKLDKGYNGVTPRRWQEVHRLEFGPSSTIKITLFRHSVVPLREPHEVGQHSCNVIRLFQNETVTMLDLTDDTGHIIPASLTIQLSLIFDPAEEIMRRVDADLDSLKDNGVLTTASGHVDDAIAIAPTGSDATKLIGSCVKPLGQALQIFVDLMDGIADAHPIVKVSWTVLSAVYKTVQAQMFQDGTVIILAESLREMVGMAQKVPDLLEIKGTMNVIEEISLSSLTVASLIDEYIKSYGYAESPFIGRMTRFQIKLRIRDCQKNCQELTERFSLRLEIETSQENKGKYTQRVDTTTKKHLGHDPVEKIYQWLSAPDSSPNYNDARKKHQAGTGSWFTNGEKFLEWKQSRRFLCIYGKPGCGKTILCSSIISHVAEICNKKESTAYAYFFFDGRDVRSPLQRYDGFIRSLIQQFTDNKLDGIPSRLTKLYGNGHQQPSTDALEDVLQDILHGFTESYIIIDSLDECAERRELLNWIMKNASSKKGNLHILATSRPEEDIKAGLRPLMSIPMEEGLVDRDIEAYIDSNIKEGRLGAWPEEVRLHIKDTLLERAQGMFRWLVMQLEELQNCLDVAESYSQLQRLPKDLDETYSRILARIPEQRRSRAKLFLEWTAFSARPLSLEELGEAAVVEFDQDNLPKVNRHRRCEPQDVLAACASLIMESDGVVKLAHFSVKEYLLSDRIANGFASYFAMNENLSHWFMAETCLAYLLHLDSSGSLEDDALAVTPLAEYAASNLVFHVRKGGGHGEHTHLITLFESWIPFYNWIRLCDPEKPRIRKKTERLTTQAAEPLYFASLLGFTLVAQQLLQHGASVQGPENSGNSSSENSYMRYGTALQSACRGNHMDTVELLIESGAEVGVQGGMLGCALQAAAWSGNKEMVELLLEKGADVNMQGGKYGCALQAAAYNSDESMVELLVEKGADVNAQAGGKYGYALQVAAITGNLANVNLLLDHGAEVNMQGGHFGSSLQAACHDGNMAIIALLLENNADLNAQGGYHGSPLQAACAEGNMEVVTLLLECNADVNIQGGYLGSPLQTACAYGEKEVVTLLLKNNADVNAQGGYYGSPLQAACAEGNMEVVTFLLECNADVNVQGGIHGSPLQTACAYGRMEMVTLLLENHADANAQGGVHGNALMAASILGRDYVVKLLLEHHADVNAPTRDYNSILKEDRSLSTITQRMREKETDVGFIGEYVYALQAAAYCGHTKIVKMLLERGADVNAQGGICGNAVQAAWKGGHDGITKLLLAQGATWLQDLDD